jgi:hypothetical protein
MSHHAPAGPLESLVSRHLAALRRALALRHGLRAAGWIAAVITLGVTLGLPARGTVALAWLRLAVVAAASLAALAAAVAGFRRARPSRDTYLQRIEERYPVARSWLRNALDFARHSPAHTSPELVRAVGEETARRLRGVPLDALRPRVAARRPLLTMVLSLAVLAALGLALPAPTARSWRTLIDPRAAAPPIRLEVEPGSATVTPGAALAVRAHVWGTPARPRLLGDGPGAVEAIREGEGMKGEHLWRFDLTQLTRPLEYRVRVAGIESPRYHVTLAGAPQPVSFELEIRPPAYARLPVQRGAATRGDISALRGASVRVEVLFDRDLTALEAEVPGAGTRPWRALNPRRWRGEILVRQAGEYELHARAAGGAGRFRYAIQPIADAPPLLTVRLPEGDVDLPAGGQVPYEVLGQDDLGLTELRLQTHRDPDAPWSDVTLARFAEAPREVHVAGRWDAGALGLLPGESAGFRFQLFDDNTGAPTRAPGGHPPEAGRGSGSGRGVAVSPVFQLRFPSLAELYEGVERSQDSVRSTLEEAAVRAQELQKALDRIARQAPAPAAANPRSFERQEEVRSALDRQQELSRRIDDAAGRLHESLEQAAERRAFDEQLMTRMRELAEVVSGIQSPEFRAALRRLQESLESVAPRPPDAGLRDWQRQGQEMLRNLERTLELLKQLRQEEQLQALARRAADLKAAQDARNQEIAERAGGEPPAAKTERAAAQQEAAAETDRLARDAHELGQEMPDPGARDALERASGELEQQAAPAQREAARALEQDRRGPAQRSGQRASQSLAQAAAQLGQLSSSIQEGREQVDAAAVRRAAQDLLSLQRSAEANLGSAAPARERGDRQSDLAEGTARVADSLWALSKRSPFIDRKLAEALGRAMGGLQQSSRQLGQGDRAGGEQSGRAAAGALLEAVMELRETESSMCRGPGQGKPTGSAPNRMHELGEQQGALNDRTRRLTQRLSEQARVSAGDRDQLEAMATEQARLRDELRRIEEEDRERRQLLGDLGHTAEEMKQVEEALRQGRFGDEVEQRQQHILSRLLDAERTVNRQDFDPKRESRPGEDARRASPAALPAELLRESDRLRLDLLKAQADRYPAQYRAFVEAYLRALNSGGAR